jgi:O-antigen/teichoic acid export membrane protein
MNPLRLWKSHRDYALNSLSDVIITAVGFVSSILIARGLGPEGRGQLAAAFLWPMAFAALSTLGLPHAFAYAAGARWASPGRLARFGTAFALVVGVPIAFAYFLAAPYFLRVAFPRPALSLRLFGCFIPLTLWAALWAALYQGKGDFVTWNLAKVLRSAGYTAWVAMALFLGVASVPVVLWSQVVLAVLSLTLLGLRMPRLPADDSPGAVPVAKLLRYGLSVYASGILYMLNQQLDQLLLSVWVPARELGQYAAAASLSAIVLVAPSALGPVVFSRLARTADEEGYTHAWRALFLGGAILLPAGLLLTAFAPALVRLIYGPAFAPAGQLLRVLMPAAVLLGFSILLADILRGAGRPLLPTFAMLAGVGVTIPGLAFALPRYGVWGAAWVSLCAYGAMFVVEAASFLLVSGKWRLRG